MVSAIIPARNEEASVARAVESVAAQPEIGEVIVVDDQSTDRTGAILAELATRIPKLRVLATDGLPSGWTGKNYALSIGAAEATGDWLLFTDADTYHLPGSTRRALSDAIEHDAVLVSYSPEQEMETFWEKALIPVIYTRLAARFSYARVSDPNRPDAAANGQFLLILRDVYDKLGGHNAVSVEVLEDVAIAQRVKRAGYRIYFTAPFGTVRTRMYRSFAAMWEGWTKNLYPLIGGRVASLLRELAGHTPLLGVMIVALWVPLAIRTHTLPTFFGLLAWFVIIWHAKYGMDLYKNLLPLSLIQYCVPGACLYGCVLLASWWKNTHGAVTWKGRAYAAKAESRT